MTVAEPELDVRAHDLGDMLGRAERERVRRGHLGEAVVGELRVEDRARSLGGSSRMTVRKVVVRSIVEGSRPSAAQCSARIRFRSAISSSVPDAFQPSPYRATVRSVFRGPAPPIRIGRCAWMGRGSWLASRSV